jgi:multisubunit Na+/H+ antiporter MnhF subunit
MESLLTWTVQASLAAHLVMGLLCVWRICRGENPVDRLIGLELLGMMMLAVLVLLAILLRDAIFVDAALGLAALGFISTIALAKYMADQQMF